MVWTLYKIHPNVRFVDEENGLSDINNQNFMCTDGQYHDIFDFTLFNSDNRKKKGFKRYYYRIANKFPIQKCRNVYGNVFRKSTFVNVCRYLACDILFMENFYGNHRYHSKKYCYMWAVTLPQVKVLLDKYVNKNQRAYIYNKVASVWEDGMVFEI